MRVKKLIKVLQRYQRESSALGVDDPKVGIQTIASSLHPVMDHKLFIKEVDNEVVETFVVIGYSMNLKNPFKV
jgi:hypothetical protein